MELEKGPVTSSSQYRKHWGSETMETRGGPSASASVSCSLKLPQLWPGPGARKARPLDTGKEALDKNMVSPSILPYLYY